MTCKQVSLPCSVIQEKGAVFLFYCCRHIIAQQHRTTQVCYLSVSATSRFLCSGFHKGQGQVSGQLGSAREALGRSPVAGRIQVLWLQYRGHRSLAELHLGAALSPWRPLARGSCTPELAVAPAIHGIWCFCCCISWNPAGESFLLFRFCMIRVGPPDNPGLS